MEENCSTATGDKMIAAAVVDRAEFHCGQTQAVVRRHYETAAGFSCSGQTMTCRWTPTLLMVKEGAQEQAPTQINVVLNWFEELKQKGSSREKVMKRRRRKTWFTTKCTGEEHVKASLVVARRDFVFGVGRVANSAAKDRRVADLGADLGTRGTAVDQINASNFSKLVVRGDFKTDNLGTRQKNKLEGRRSW